MLLEFLHELNAGSLPCCSGNTCRKNPSPRRCDCLVAFAYGVTQNPGEQKSSIEEVQDAIIPLAVYLAVRCRP
jgi:hypothetical protein